MKTIQFPILIQATRQAAWETMLEPATVRLWTADFAEGSSSEGSRDEGERIRFLTPALQKPKELFEAPLETR